MTTEEKEQASASIMITLDRDIAAQKEIDGYYNLVKTLDSESSSLDNITISSPEGELLASSEVGGSTAIGGDLLETHYQIQRKYENDLKQKIQTFLGPIVGMDNLVVNVVQFTLTSIRKSRISNWYRRWRTITITVLCERNDNSKSATGAAGSWRSRGNGRNRRSGLHGQRSSSWRHFRREQPDHQLRLQ